VKKTLSHPDSYYKIYGIGAEAFKTLLADNEIEDVAWEFRYKAPKPNTIFGQAQDNPRVFGSAICRINKKTGVVSARMIGGEK